MSELLMKLAKAIAKEKIKVIDLTQTLRPSTPVIQLPPPFAPTKPFEIEEISRYDDKGPAWYWNNIALGEHTGTHFDAPIHWVTGKDYKDGATDTVPVQRFVAPAVVIDCSKDAKKDEKFLLTPKHILAWEKKHDTIPKGSWVLMRTDWSKRDAVGYANLRDDGAHTPGPTPAAMRFLVEERGVLGFGTETIGTDAGQAHHFVPPYPAHHYLHGAGRYGLQCLCNLDLLPARGAVLVAAPLKIRQGSGSPLRVLALVEG